MIIYKDVFSGDELASDSYPHHEEGCVIIFEGKMVTIEEGDYGIAANVDDDAAEGAVADGLDASVAERVIDIVNAHKLQETPFDKKTYLAYIKGYMSRLKAHLEKEKPERVADFMKEAQAFVKKIISTFNDYSFYTGESCDPDAMVMILFYKEDGVSPCFYVFKDGVTEERF